jgi:hypothetical protein
MEGHIINIPFKIINIRDLDIYDNFYIKIDDEYKMYTIMDFQENYFEANLYDPKGFILKTLKYEDFKEVMIFDKN